MGRPLKEIDAEQVKKLAMINCSYEEIAAVIGCDPKTLTNRFSQVIKEGREHGKSSLKRAMWKKGVIEGNCTMQIWLSKNMLGYKDRELHVASGSIEGGELIVNLTNISAKDRKWSSDSKSNK